ncbi:protein of unknown function [Cyanobium sp. NIES-981]|nr:protein of unknown function [Cyanobium sp. NIES-981]
MGKAFLDRMPLNAEGRKACQLITINLPYGCHRDMIAKTFSPVSVISGLMSWFFWNHWGYDICGWQQG